MSIEDFQVFFGGTFDPPHLGHHDMLCALARDPWVKKVHLVPTGQNPLKENVPACERLEWIQLWLKVAKAELGEIAAKIKLETFEFDRADHAPSFTVDSLAQLRQSETGKRWALCVGADLLGQLPRWKKINELLAQIDSVWVFPREQAGDTLLGLDAEFRCRTQFRLMSTAPRTVSSTQIRDFLQSPNALQNLERAPLLPALKEKLRNLVLSRERA